MAFLTLPCPLMGYLDFTGTVGLLALIHWLRQKHLTPKPKPCKEPTESAYAPDSEAENDAKATRKLWMQSGDERVEVTVIEVTEKCITVELNYGDGFRYFPVFDKDGRQPEGDDPDFNIYMYGADSYLVPRPLRGINGEPFHLVGV